MKILLFGVSNVGKTTVGKQLAERLGYMFYDLDEEIKKYMNMTLEEFTNTSDLEWRDRKRGIVMKHILDLNEELVLAVTPISYTGNISRSIHASDSLLIELYDSPENIFSRLVFSDENDHVYTDDEYKERYKQYYLKMISEDLEWYGKTYRRLNIQNRVYMNNDSPEKVVDKILDTVLPKYSKGNA